MLEKFCLIGCRGAQMEQQNNTDLMEVWQDFQDFWKSKIKGDEQENKENE
jgi:hypothetical protein